MATARRAPRSDFDTAWKEVLRRHFPAAMAFFFPQIHAALDWSRGYSFHDKELQHAVGRSGRGKRKVDLLARVWLKKGGKAWILIHVEVQNQPDPDFEMRMYVYNALLFSRHRQVVVSLGILGDTKRSWRPSQFTTGAFGCQVSFEFPTVKLLDYRDRIEELKQSRNLWGILVFAHLKTLDTRPDSETRLQWKKRITRGMLEAQLSKDEIRDAFRFVDLIMTLAPRLEANFETFVTELEEEHNMPFMSHYERRALVKGRQEGSVQASRTAVLDALEVRFKRPPDALRNQIQQFDDAGLLRDLYRRAITAPSLDDFVKSLHQEKQPA